MIKIIVLAVFSLLSITAFAQKVMEYKQTSKYLAYIKGDTFEGASISKDFVLPFMPEMAKELRFTPSAQDIEAVELLLNTRLKEINFRMVNQGKKLGPVIHDNLAKYARQYFGYISPSGDRIVFVSNLWEANYKTENDKNWKIGAVIVMDGGSNYWQVKANLTKQSLYDLSINGAG